MDINQILEARALAPSVPQNQTTADKSPWMVVQYVPALGTGASAATIVVAATSETMTFLVDAASTSGADAIAGDSSMLSLVGSIDTMGEVVDFINGRSAWRAYLVGALRSDVPSHLLNFSASSCIGDNGLVLYSDTTDSLEVSTAISGEKFVNNGVNGHVKDYDDGCINEMLYGAFNIGDNGTGATITLKFYTGLAGSDETQIGGSISIAEDTQKLLGDSNLTLPYIAATRGHRLVVRVATSSTFDAYTEFNVVGKTSVLKGNRFVDEDNF